MTNSSARASSARVRCRAPLLAAAALFLSGCQPDTRAQQTPNNPSEDAELVPAPELRKSPMAVAAATLENGTYVKIVYSSPRKRGRRIFGGLVPYGEVWRTGANEATEITVTRPVLLAGNRLEAGTYALFTIPKRDTWTVIVNATLGQWGAYDYDASTDVMRFEVPSSETDKMYEAFVISVEEGRDGKNLNMVWEETMISIPISPA